ncbi:MAG: ATP-binding protein [Tenericutes bacterium]|nr:ATP-binding protein [Mycoplasmatota bacterium]
MIKREKYISELLLYKNKPFIKVLTGLRRVGKSVLLDMYVDQLVNSGINKENVLKINFELPEFFNIIDYNNLTDYVINWTKNKEGSLYLILDEIGRVENWEKAVNAFHTMSIFDIYITGSNADLLSSDLSTYLAGRYVEIPVYPLSYKEFTKLYPNSKFNDYIIFGGMPSISALELDYKLSMNVLRDAFRSAVFQDIVTRHRIRNAFVLEKLILYVFQNTGKTFSALSISKYFKSQNIKVSVDTVLNYLDIIEDSFLIYRVRRNDIIGKSILKTEEKYFVADHGMREAIIGGNQQSIELILENIVYTELLRRGYTVYIGKVKEFEVDFIAKKENLQEYYQVCYLLESKKVREREFGVYNLIPDNFPKYVISMDTINFSSNGTIHKNIVDFLEESN